VGAVWEYLGAKIATISSLQPGEHGILLASIEACLVPKKFHCATCITQYGTNERLVKKTELKRKGKGCFDYKTKAYRLDNIKYNTCIGNFAVPIDYFLEAFSLYEKGVLPFKGTVGDQPNKIMEIFGLIDVRRSEKMKQG